MTDGTKAPWHLWLMVVLGIIWNGYGAYDYIMSQTRNAEYLANFPPEMITMLDGFPIWANAMWAFGVWGSVAGTILLIIRSRYAAWAFLLSLIGASVNFVHGLTQEMPESMQGPMMTALPVIIIAIIVLQLFYSRRQAAAGVLG